MSRGGHNRKPRELKVLHGTFRNDRNPDNEPEPEVLDEVPSPPSGMNTPARRMWKRLGEYLVQNQLLTEADLETFEILCVQYGQYKELWKAIHRKQKGHYEKTDNGRLRFIPEKNDKGKPVYEKQTLAEYMKGKNAQTMPEYNAMKASFQLYKSYMSEFGLSPVARNRIDIPKPQKEDDPMERLFQEK